MSNSYRRLETPAPTPSTASANSAPAELPTAEQRMELVSAAITKLYLARGGDDIDQQIKVARADADNALICREAERKRLAENPNALREKGERPFVTVSEDRLHSRASSRGCMNFATPSAASRARRFRKRSIASGRALLMSCARRSTWLRATSTTWRT